MKVEIDINSGYCFGVEFAIQMAEDEMNQGGTLYCLGDICLLYTSPSPRDS